MTYTSMVRWFEHRAWSQVARANHSIYGEIVRADLSAPKATLTATTGYGATYDGPTIYSESNGPRRQFIWIANGVQSLEHQFGTPQTLQPTKPPTSANGGPHASIGSLVAESPIDPLELDEDKPAFGDIESDTSSATVVRVLGPVEVLGWRVKPERPILTELVCYLALHRDRPVSGDALRAALRPDESDKEQSAKTLRTYLSMLRKSLGPDVLPNATSAGYRLSDTVTTDWDEFLTLSELPDPRSKVNALRLIRGRPFEDVAAESYAWVFTEFWISDIEVAIVARAKETARLCRDAGRSDDALFALRQGLLAVRSDFTLWEMYLACASDAGETALNRVQSEARAALGDDAPC